MNKIKKQKNNLVFSNKGFSLVELVVVISIFAIMTTVSTLRFNDHRDSVVRTNIVNDIALTVRQAQVYGISASAKNIGGTSFDDSTTAEEFFDNNTGIVDITTDKSIRGVSFHLDEGWITLFEDTDRDKVYRDSAALHTDRLIDRREILSSKVYIEYIYLCNNGSCVKKNSGVLDIAFERPYPDALIHYRTSGSISGSLASPYTYVAIVVSDGSNKNQYVEVFSIGNITTKVNHEI